MNKILVLAKNKDTYFIKKLREEVSKEKLVLFDPWNDPLPSRHEDFDFVFVRTTGVYGDNKDLEILQRHFSSTKIINPLPAHLYFRSKKTQYELMESLGFPVLPWLDLKSASQNTLIAFIGTNEPASYLIKPHRGQGGWGIRCFTPLELLNWYEENFRKGGDLEYILHPYLEDVREIRVFFIGDWDITLERKKIGSAVAANFKQQGEALVVQDPPWLCSIMENLKKMGNLHYGAIDFFETQNGPRILDINAVPGIEQLEKSTGYSIITKLLQSLNCQV